jgi:cell filamentation protein
MRHKNDGFCYTGTTVLINLADLRTQEELDRFEAARVAMNFALLRTEPMTRDFNEIRLKETHRRIFEGVYPWAGQYRHGTGYMAKERGGQIVSYGNDMFISGEVSKTMEKLSKESFQSLDKKAFSERLAYYYSELDAIHPFREGNSRTLRVFTSDFAHSKGFDLDWSKISATEQNRQKLYHARDVAVIKGDTEPLAALMSHAMVADLKLYAEHGHKYTGIIISIEANRITQKLSDKTIVYHPLENLSLNNIATFLHKQVSISYSPAGIGIIREYTKEIGDHAKEMEKGG